jgi:glycosyltransferase involved in cell wall biosynthesis
MRRRILIIPHCCHETVRIRAFEIARALSARHSVYCWKWKTYLPRDVSIVKRIIDKIGTDSLNAFSCSQETDEVGITNIRWPMISSSTALKTGLGDYARRINEWLTGRLLTRLQIDTVFNGNAHLFSIPPGWRGSYIFDVPDDPIGLESNRLERLAAKVLRAEAAKAKAVTTISTGLATKLERLYNLPAVVIPNGVRPEPVGDDRIRRRDELRHALNLDGSFVIGFIGNHAAFSGLDFLSEVFREVNRKYHDARLLVVGPTPKPMDDLLSGLDHVLNVGPVHPNKVQPYLDAIDIGVLPFLQTYFTENALPIKILEYSASRKLVIATPLEELKARSFPNVHLVERSVPLWVQKIIDLRSLPWREEWDQIFREYEWPQIAATLEQVMADGI